MASARRRGRLYPGHSRDSGKHGGELRQVLVVEAPWRVVRQMTVKGIDQ
jgi:hypothetical protein